MASFYQNTTVTVTDTATNAVDADGNRVGLTIQAGDQPIYYFLCETDADECTTANGNYLAARETHGWTGGNTPSNRISVLRATSTSTTVKVKHATG
jgi:hypothetical protein